MKRLHPRHCQENAKSEVPEVALVDTIGDFSEDGPNEAYRRIIAERAFLDEGTNVIIHWATLLRLATLWSTTSLHRLATLGL